MTIDPSMAVLVVDDVATMSRIIQTLLKQIGLTNIEYARDGKSALNALKKKAFSVVISDWNMNPMDGLVLLEHVRRDPTLKNVRFILISAEANADFVSSALDERRERFLTKPFSAGVLKQTIEELFRSSET